MRKGYKAASAVCNITGLAVLLVIVLICLPLAVPRLLGYQSFDIVSGSMEPEIPTGSIVYVKAAPAEEIKEGDIISFYDSHDGSTVVSHRVMENHTAEREFITKGDANDKNDILPVPYANLIGRIKFHIPFLGRLLSFISGTTGKQYMIAFLAAALLLRIVGSRLGAKDI